MDKNIHEFALYLSTLPDVLAGDNFVLHDSRIVHRLTHVLRACNGQSYILFDRENHLRVCITDIGKNSIEMRIITREKNKHLVPYIIAFLPLLKRVHLEEAVYALVELGVNKIQLIITQKVHHKWGGAKELQRLEKIMIAAAEQSKHFAFPKIHEPISLQKAIVLTHGVKLFFDPTGEQFYDVATQLRQQKPTEITFMVGPEADLSDEEKELLKQHFFSFVQLTPTVLRAYQAATIACAIMRMML